MDIKENLAKNLSIEKQARTAASPLANGNPAEPPSSIAIVSPKASRVGLLHLLYEYFLPEFIPVFLKVAV